MTQPRSSAAPLAAAHEGASTNGSHSGSATAPDNTSPSADDHSFLDRPRANTAAASWALFAGIALVMIGNGLQGSLLGVRSELEGFSTAAAGVVMSCFFIGFLVGGRFATTALTSVGHIRVFAALASTASTAALVHAVWISPVTWAAMRFATGVCMAGLYVVAESWINDLATNATRGRMLAIYMAVTMGGIATGQGLLNLADPDGFELFVVSSALISLSLVPVSLSASSTPPTHTPEPMPVVALARAVPTGVVVSTLVGTAHGSLLGMGAVYATGVGLSPAQVALFMAAPMIGGFALQLPIGAISDRVPRRGVMFFVAAATAVSAGGLLMTAPGSVASYWLMFLVGGFSFPLYSLGIAYTNDWIRQEQLTGASASLVFVNGIGAIFGPLAAAGLIAGFGNRSYFIVLITTHGAIAVYLAWRIVFREALPMSRQGRFVPFPVRASATATQLLTRRRRRAPRPDEARRGHDR